MRTNATKQFDGRTEFSLVEFPYLVSPLELEMPNWYIPWEKFLLNEVQIQKESE